MSIADYVPGLGGDGSVHRECRECGRNLGPDAEVCPDCGGGVSRYELP